MNKVYVKIIVIFLSLVAVVGLLVGASKVVLKNNNSNDLRDSSDAFSEDDTSVDDSESGEISCVHVFDAGIVSKEPTCGDVGTRIYTCTKCNVVREEKIPRLKDHAFNDGVVSLEATCIKDGKLLKTCFVCGFKKEETIPKNKIHKFSLSGVCTLCGSTCSHKFGDFVLSSTDNTKHERQCLLCKLKDMQAHKYTDGVCIVCNYICSHSFGDGVCIYCKKVCDHSDSNYSSLNDKQHSFECTICDYYIIEDHPLSFGVCNWCGYECSHEYVYSDILMNGYDEEYHSFRKQFVCKLCGSGTYENFDESHNFVDDTCEFCGYTKPDVCDHSNRGWELNDFEGYQCLHDGTHQINKQLICYSCHTVLDVSHTIGACSGFYGYCDLCGYEFPSYDPEPDIGDSSCSHNNTSTTGDGCWTVDFCQDCGATLNMEHTGYEDNGIDGRCALCGEY